MPVFKRELAFMAKPPVGDAGDWWHLVFNTDPPGLYVEHTWRKAHAVGGAATGTERFGINDFLTLAEARPAQPALMSAIREMFGEAQTEHAPAATPNEQGP